MIEILWFFQKYQNDKLFQKTKQGNDNTKQYDKSNKIVQNMPTIWNIPAYYQVYSNLVYTWNIPGNIPGVFQPGLDNQAYSRYILCRTMVSYNLFDIPSIY